MIRQYELVDKVREYDKDVDEALLNRAYVFAMKAHGSQKRASGDPYFSHPLEVAAILTDMGLDCDTIATALLHDVVEDTVATIDEIHEVFGPKIAELVDGVTKLSKIEMQTETMRQAENFRKFVLAMSNDIRVLLVKLADRLHNMRTLHFIKKEEKRRRIAIETMEIYAPLAERIGMHSLQDELEHLAFEQIDPEAMASISARLAFLQENNPELEAKVGTELYNLLKENGVKARIDSRMKSPYSIWRKMERMNVSFEELWDVIAFRLIVENDDDCYKALGIVHRAWPMIPGRFKDYVSVPKRNFYRSIHTTVLGPDNRRVEIQVRTERMHREAEYGVAAHWEYKSHETDVEGSKYRWVRELLEILDDASHPEEFLEHTKLAMFQDKVFCFTPKGELISLPRGSSPIDFAYAVHTEVGDHCVGAKVNSRMVPLRHQLENGDQVDIQTSKAQAPSTRWESFVVTGKARSAIRRHMRFQERDDYVELGKTLLEKACIRGKLDFAEVAMEQACKVLNIDDLESLYEIIGRGTIQEGDILRAAYPGYQQDDRKQLLPDVHQDWEEPSQSSIPIKGIKAHGAVHLADCCHPVRDDRIVGIKVPAKGLEIHRIECLCLDDYEHRPELWVDLMWKTDGDDQAYYTGKLKLAVANEMGSLGSIAADVAKRGGNIANVEIPDRDQEFITMIIEVEVQNSRHLSDISRSLRGSPIVTRVDRM